MSIKIRNLGDFTILLSVPGSATTTSATVNGSTACGGPAPFAGIVSAIYALYGKAGSGTTNATVDLLQNETTMVTSGALLTFASGATIPTYNTANLKANPPTVAAGDIFSLAVNSVHSTTVAQDLVVAVVIQRLPGTGPAAAVQTGSYGEPY